MQKLTGYIIKEQLYTGDKIIVSRAIRKIDNQPVVLKMLKAEYPDPDDIARLNYEYDLLKQLEIHEIVRAYAFEKQQNSFALVLESISNSTTLRNYLHTHQLNITAFLRLAIKMANALDKVHEAGIIHKDINPDNILVIGEGEAVKILDLSLATQLQEEQLEIINSESLEGTFPYISPEQTTRMNRPIDRRTDLYSLGITFYEILVGHLPFDAKDPIEWVHCHIAKQPLAPHKLLSSIPEMISIIILKLLAKSADDRYATAFGLKMDLETVLVAWQKNHDIPSFELGKNDRKGIFQIPQKLYGRETEIQTLLNAFDNASKGHRESLIIAGYTGVGKSSLINEIQKPIVKQHGYFTSGKYENYKREIPYAGLIQAFRNLINQILAGSKQRIQTWQQDILKVISPNAQVIINVIPELEKLVGKQPPVIELPPAESRTRFEMVFFDFVSVFAKKEHPLVIFLDDLQWADVGTFNLISQLMKNADLKYFLLLGAYRDNEITSTHPLSTMLENFGKEHISYQELQLKPLSADHLKQLVCDTLNTSNDIQSLTDLIMEKTAGNPYFVNLFLTTLYKTQQLKFDQTHNWLFDIDAIKNSPITDNVVDLVISEIGKLSPETQELLRFAACIGTDFDLESLMQLTGKPAEEITFLLWSALQEKWIMQLGESYKQIIKNAYHISINYRFSHDNVKHTLYSLTDQDTRKQIHYKLGKSLLKTYNLDHAENLFVITQHFSACLDNIQDPEEKIEIAKVFYHAANQMKMANSYDMAIKHYDYALVLLGTDIWEKHYTLATNIYSHLAMAQFLAGAFEKSNSLFDEIISKSKTPLEKAKIYNIRVLSYSAQAQYDESVKACEEGLRILGLSIPKNPNRLLLARMWFKIKWHLWNKKIDDLLDLPIMQDPSKIMIMELLEKFANFSFMGSPGNFNKPAYVIMLSVLYSIKYGNHSNSSICYALLGQIEVMRDNIERAYQFGNLAIKLSERFQNANLPLVYLLVVTRIYPWKVSYKEMLKYTIKAFELSYETGQMYCHQYSATALAINMNFSNLPIMEIVKKIESLLADYQVACNFDVTLFLKSLLYMLQIVHGDKPLSDYNSFIKETDALSNLRSPTLGLVGINIQGLVLSYLFEDWSQAMEIMKETKKAFLRKPLNTMPAAPIYYFYSCLSLLSNYRQAPFFKRLSYRRTIKKMLAQLKFWQSHCPANYGTFYYLVKAGIAAELHNNMDQALKDYEASLVLSREYDRLFIQAMTHEFIGRCYLRQQQPRNARGYLQDAYAAYQQAGFIAKVNSLKNNFPELLSAANIVTTATSVHSRTHTTSVLDIDTVLKSAQTISSQMKLEKLLETLIDIVMENAGAQRSVLLLLENDRLIVEAEGKTDTKSIVLHKEVIESRQDLPLSVIQYVQNTQEPVVLGNAVEEGVYTEDFYIIENKPLSILCAPIIYKNHLFGILYLENNLVCEAFTQKHLELLKVLSSQIAISLENARLYAAYDQFIPHEFLDILGKHSIIDISLGDNVQKEMSILFTDIRGFSKLSEQLGPQEIFKFMNNYLGHMAPIIKNHDGFIDKYIGDAIMALFPGEVSSAITAGIEMQKELCNFNQELISQGKQPIAIGIGINSGNLTLGTLGSLNRIETSVLSDAVNVAERIQDLTKTYDSRLLISGAAYKKLANPELFDMRFIERTLVRGRDEIIDIWEVYNGDNSELRYAKLAIAKHYNEAIDYFLNHSYQKALTLFQRCLVSVPNDKVILKYIAQCLKLLGMKEINNTA